MNEITCTRCGVAAPRRGRHQKYCAECRREAKRERNRRWRAKNIEAARECTRCWRAKNPEVARECARRWKAKNPEAARECARRWYAKNPEAAREHYRRWRAENPEVARERVRRWRAKNIEAARECTRRWRAKNPEAARECARECARRWRAKNPEAERHVHLKRYGLDLTTLPPDAVERSRSGCCEICGCPPGAKALHIDHDHATGAFRGVLCGNCNRGLGQLGDSVAGLKLALNYLTAAAAAGE